MAADTGITSSLSVSLLLLLLELLLVLLLHDALTGSRFGENPAKGSSFIDTSESELLLELVDELVKGSGSESSSKRLCSSGGFVSPIEDRRAGTGRGLYGGL